MDVLTLLVSDLMMCGDGASQLSISDCRPM